MRRAWLKSLKPINKNEKIVKDIIAIMNVYVAKINGLRKYKKIIKHNIISKKSKTDTQNMITCDKNIKSNKTANAVTDCDELKLPLSERIIYI